MVEISSGWRRWAKRSTDPELEEINLRLHQLQEGFGKPHLHAGLGIRRLGPHIFEFRVSSNLRAVFVIIRPNIFRLVMCGNYDDVRTWLKENA